MCMPSRCANEGCGRKTWWGCGKHIDSVMSKIPAEEQCDCENHNPANPATSFVKDLFGGSNSASVPAAGGKPAASGKQDL